MAINKVIKKGVVELDLTSDTVTPETLVLGTTAHNAAGESIIGTASSGVDTTDATATAADMLSGKTAYAKGEKITGTFTLDSELTTQDDLISQIQTALQNKAAGPTLQTKTVTPSTSKQEVKPDTGYDGLSQVTVGAIPSTYVKPTTTKSATTYTPSTSNQTIAAGTYCSGAQTIKGDSNLVAGNIKSGVSIFGVAGSYEGSGSSDSITVETCIVAFTYIDYINDNPGTLYYLKPDLTYGQATYQASREEFVPGTEVTVVKNSIVAFCDSGAEGLGISVTGTENMVLVESFFQGMAILVTEDCILSFTNG